MVLPLKAGGLGGAESEGGCDTRWCCLCMAVCGLSGRPSWSCARRVHVCEGKRAARTNRRGGWGYGGQVDVMQPLAARIHVPVAGQCTDDITDTSTVPIHNEGVLFVYLLPHLLIFVFSQTISYYRCTYEWMDVRMDGWMDGLGNDWMDGWM